MKQEIAVNVRGTKFGFSLFDLKVIIDELERLYPEASITSLTSEPHTDLDELSIICRPINLDPWIIVFTRSDEWLGCFDVTYTNLRSGDVL